MEQKIEEADSNNKVMKDLILNDSTTMEDLNDDCLIHIFKYLPIKDKIRLEKVNKRWRAASQASWSNIKKLDFNTELWGNYEIDLINNDLLTKVFKQCGKYLRHLQMYNDNVKRSMDYVGFMVPGSFMNLLIQSYTSKHIDFTLKLLSVENWPTFSKHSKNIEKISFGEICAKNYVQYMVDQIIKVTAFTTYKNLRVIEFYRTGITGHCLRFIYTEYIEELEFICCHELISSVVGNVISQCHKLKKLTLRQCTDLALSKFMYPKSLQYLDISCNNVIHMNDDFFRNLTETCRNLSNLNLCYNRSVSDIGLAYVASLPNLEYLNVDSIQKITGQTFSNMPRLKKLSCARCEDLVEEHLLKLLEVSDQLEFLDISFCNIKMNKFIPAAVSYLKTRKNNVILNIILDFIAFRLRHYAVELPDNLKFIEKKPFHSN